ncbi:unnamed protein product [Bemisia tabaci]|uniref:RNA-binding region-containing protein 3 n=1 Tax=Bemisia tabaci TaxID=7038 RepID=A0A9P0A1X4_BEMTA|nr:unnamed protein product [Bemisia tabaci]
MDSTTPPSDTLIVRNFSNELEDDSKRDFFHYFGANEIRILKSRTKKNASIIARFPSKYHAAAVLQKIHQTKLGSSRLSAEFAKTETSFPVDEEKCSLETGVKEKSKHVPEPTSKSALRFLNSMNNWLSGVNFKVPPPCHLRYQYPPPSPEVLENIAKALAAVPKFYTQVLHLMNKMNLPSPFEPDFPIICDNLFEIKKPSNETNIIADNPGVPENSNDEESEIESDEDVRTQLKVVIPDIKSKPKKAMKLNPLKVLKSKRVEKTSPSKRRKLETENVFEKSHLEPGQKTIQVKLTTPDLNSIARNETELLTEEGGFGVLNVTSQVDAEPPVSSRTENEEETLEDDYPCITAKELAANRLSKKDLSNLPVFKNYSPGIPSCRLYIKNLAKKVTPADLHHIYRRYFLKYHEEQGTMFDVRLMQEGRMKGQAFVTLQTVEQTKKALEETNGYILKDKPMVVQFARSAPATKLDSSAT